MAESVLLYGAPVWSSMVERIPAYTKILIGAQRRGLLRVVSSYKSVSAETLQVIVGVPPVDLLGEGEKIVFRIWTRAC